MRAALSFSALASVIFFPWLFTVLLALVASFVEPLVPLAVGICADTFYYYASSAEIFPFFTLGGTIATAIALFVHSRLRTGIISR
ncbi:MAG: hypothetical protein ACYC75_03300 [Minisyncoccota bacterium]